MKNPTCDRCHKNEGVAWVIWPEIGKRWLCVECGEYHRKMVRAIEVSRLQKLRDAEENK